MKKIYILLILFLFSSCAANLEEREYTRFSTSTLTIFDSVTSILGYATSQEEFDFFSNEIILQELFHFHRLFNKFNSFDGVNNIKTINENAGIKPVEVHPSIIELLLLGMEAYYQTDGIVNIAIGSVTNIWRQHAVTNTLPQMDILIEASKLTRIEDVIIDVNASTVFLRHEGMHLDIGSIGKGFAIEKAAQAAIDAGFESFTLSIGGDARITNAPKSEGRYSWGVGVINPENPSEFIEAVFLTNTSIVTSGDYMRYFMVDGTRYHHIINPRTLMPANTARSVTVIYPCSIVAENLSLAAFILPLEEAKILIQSHGAEAIWVLEDGSLTRV